MKKYRLTKITVRTREIVLLPKNAADETQPSVCPVCSATLNFALPATGECETENEAHSIQKQKNKQ